MWGWGTQGYGRREDKPEPLVAGFGALVTLSVTFKLLTWPGLVGPQEGLALSAVAALAMGIWLMQPKRTGPRGVRWVDRDGRRADPPE